MSSKSWSEIEETSSILGIKILFCAYRLLGRRVFTLLLAPVIVYYFVSNRTARRASVDYLSRLRAQGVLSSRGPLWWWSIRHFMHFGSGLLDKLGVWSGAIKIEPLSYAGNGRQSLLRHSQQGQGMVLVTCHLGNVEASRVVADSHRRVPMNILVHTRHAEKFNKLLHEMDEESSLNLLQVTDISPATALSLNEKIQKGEAVVIAGDRTPVGGGERQSPVDFLGAPAPFPHGPFILASLLKCPVYFLACVRHQGGFQIIIEPFAERIRLSRKHRDRELAEWAQAYARRLESYVVRHPLQWFNFYDFWSTPESTKRTDTKNEQKS